MYLSKQKEFYSEIKTLIEQSRSKIFDSVNLEIIKTYWQIGKRIFEEEQNEKEQTIFSAYLIEDLAAQLTRDFGNGFNSSNLIYMRQFFRTFPVENMLRPILSWSHYRLIINLDEDQAKLFYMNNAADNHWSVQQLTHQIESHNYHRTFSTGTKEQENQGLPENKLQSKPTQLIKDPLVLKFLDIKPITVNLEQELKIAILDKIQDFLLDLANGYCLVSRQKLITSDQNEHYHIDLVFYNYLLRCFILINVRLDAFSDEDSLIMDRYVKMYDDKFKPKDDNPTFGILICSQNGDTEVKYSSPNDPNQIFITLYQLVIPAKEEFAEIVRVEIQHKISESQLYE